MGLSTLYPNIWHASRWAPQAGAMICSRLWTWDSGFSLLLHIKREHNCKDGTQMDKNIVLECWDNIQLCAFKDHGSIWHLVLNSRVIQTIQVINSITRLKKKMGHGPNLMWSMATRGRNLPTSICRWNPLGKTEIFTKSWLLSILGLCCGSWLLLVIWFIGGENELQDLSCQSVFLGEMPLLKLKYSPNNECCRSLDYVIVHGFSWLYGSIGEIDQLQDLRAWLFRVIEYIGLGLKRQTWISINDTWK